MIWHLVISMSGHILGVFGAALRQEAEAYAASPRLVGAGAFVSSVRRTERPQVGAFAGGAA